MVQVGRIATCQLPFQLVVFVTGSASGIGYAQAELFLRQGHYVYGVDCQVGQMKLLEQQYGERFLYYLADVACYDEVERAVAHCITQFNKIDVVCNTAGILDDFKKLEDTSLALFDRMMRVNVYGMFNVARATLPYLLAQPASRLINMASIASLTAGGGGVSYTTSKHAVAGLTKQLAYDYSQTGLRVNAIAPGAIRTNMTQADFEQEAEVAQWVADQVPTKRWATPQEVAELTLFLASDASDYMQGTIIPMDGGWLIR